MVHIVEHVRSHYEVREVPFGKVYEWHPAHITLGCACGVRSSLAATSTVTTCRRCGADLGGFFHDLEERVGRLPDRLIHPWVYDANERAQQRLRDETAHAEGSPWRYNDITAGP